MMKDISEHVSTLFTAASEKGDRAEQQDAWDHFKRPASLARADLGVVRQSHLVVVADGMGGYPNGAEAARAAVAACGNRWKTMPRGTSMMETFADIFHTAHVAAEKAGGGVAMTAVWLHAKVMIADVAWSGDVKAFRLSPKGIRAETRPHRPPYRKNALTMHLGVRGGGGAFEHVRWGLSDNRAILVATDGVWDVEGVDLSVVTSWTPVKRATFLVSEAMRLGEVSTPGKRDNGTAVVVSR